MLPDKHWHRCRFRKAANGMQWLVLLAGFNGDGEPQVEISKATNRAELDLEQTRRNLHRMRISGREWKAIEPGLREVYRQCRKTDGKCAAARR